MNHPIGGGVDWDTVACSLDGTRIVVGGSDSYLRTSSDCGLTWTSFPYSYSTWTGTALSADGNRLLASASSSVDVYDSTGKFFGPETTVGTTGCITGAQNAAIELQYAGDGKFVPLTHEGALGAN